MVAQRHSMSPDEVGQTRGSCADATPDDGTRLDAGGNYYNSYYLITMYGECPVWDTAHSQPEVRPT